MISIIIFFLQCVLNLKISALHTWGKPVGTSLNQKNWSYSGSTVLTSDYVMLTPKSKSEGWITGPSIPTANFESTIEFKIKSDYLIMQRDDSLAVHYHDEPSEKINNAPLINVLTVGTKLKGFSVILKRDLSSHSKNNLKLFLIDNTTKERDIGTSSDFLYLSEDKVGKSNNACNINGKYFKNFKLLIKKEKRVVTVYAITTIPQGTKNKKTKYECLKIRLNKDLNNPPVISVSSQSRSNVQETQIQSMTTLYNPDDNSNREKIEEETFYLHGEKQVIRLKKSQNSTFFKRSYWLSIFVFSIILFLETVWQLSQMSYLSSEQDVINPTKSSKTFEKISKKINFVRIFIFLFFVISFNLIALLFLLFPSAYSLKEIISNEKENKYSKIKMLSLYISSFFYFLFFIFSFSNLVSF